MSLVSGIQYSTEITGRRNAIINGDFDIWQRGTSQTTGGYDSDDRWQNNNAGTTKVASQQTFTLGQTDVPNNPKYYARTIVTTSAGASNYAHKRQRIEGAQTFAGETITLSFSAKADASKDIAIEMKQNFGTGGSPSAEVTAIGVTTFTLTTSWEKYTVTITIPSVSGKTLGTNNDDFLSLSFWFDAGTTYDSRTNSLGQQSGTFDIAQVQVEKGDVATDFERRSTGEELALCQRYFWNDDSISSSTTYHRFGIVAYQQTASADAQIVFPVTMRTAPSATISALAHFGIHYANTIRTGTLLEVNEINVETADMRFTGLSGGAAGGAGVLLANNNNNAHIWFDAEL